MITRHGMILYGMLLYVIRIPMRLIHGLRMIVWSTKKLGNEFVEDLRG